jgi:RHS repeat-associated protein
MGFSTQKFFPEHTPKAALSPQLWHKKTASRKFFDLTKIASENPPAKPTTPREKSDRTYETAPEVINEHYRYTAFGEPEIYDSSGNKLAASAIKNEILWNSRRYDSTTNLYYYLFRHYKADYGRWLGRDPIQEWGGINLYRFANNSSLNVWDVYGLSVIGKVEQILNDPAGFINDTLVDKVTETAGKVGGAAKLAADIGKEVSDAINEQYRADNLLKGLNLSFKQLCALNECVKQNGSPDGLEDTFTNLPAINICLALLGLSDGGKKANTAMIRAFKDGLTNGLLNSFSGIATDKVADRLKDRLKIDDELAKDLAKYGVEKMAEKLKDKLKQ